MNNKTWSKLWLDYENKKCCKEAEKGFVIRIDGFLAENRVIKSLKKELSEAITKLYGCECLFDTDTTENNDEKNIIITKKDGIPFEGYRIKAENNKMTLEASDENGALYGVFHIVRSIMRGIAFNAIEADEAPSNPLRMMNHWDNMDGSIERGYSGRSFFFENDSFYIGDRTHDYARMMASIGINGIVINNVNVKNAATDLITERYFDKVRELSELFADYGIKLFLSLNFASPIELGGLKVCDPIDDEVIKWWDKKFAEVYENVPLLGGFLVKADSEGRPGPFTYGRNQADGANMLAKSIAPYGGIIIWRCFVYNCTQDWRDYKTDRARAGYDYFKGLDGEFLDNVILQIKNGPMDFQIREPVSPLLGGLTKTNQMLEVQIAQEYTGHQIDLCYLMPMFKEVLDFHTHCKKDSDTIADIVSGRAFGNKNAGMAAVINTGDDTNWTGNYLAAANLYGFGRLAYNTELTSDEIAREWVQISFNMNKDGQDKLVSMLLRSREIYEKYTSPLGIGWMVTPHDHYGPSVDGYEYSRWGTYHRADHLGLGVDRTDKGTGYAQQYYPENADLYNDPDTCPEELLLFFHHIAYDRKLKDGRTLIQYIYDSHFEGETEAEELFDIWKSLESQVSPEIYALVCHRFEMQIANAKEWRDQVNSYFFRKSGIPDEKGREIF
ncbi:alpha-glucuronidase family glycosyl hydrolase [Butyrivibrio sp. AE3004]|uniref:alpha-glucuronidase family glycosyl hydrolase n=1 Tax=Butyrivibrio sp. AE3004 TaxID=1506994 RepID=UPI000493DEB1|nr:alpha-glucuronidase family glycosyl hydrolase [Butyrivibrio sp. AE3004]